MIIGINGYIGSGKTTFCLYLNKIYNFIFINTDLLAKKFLYNDFIISYLKKNYNKKNFLFDNFGILNKFNLRKIIFNDFKENVKLVKIILPLVIKEINNIFINNNNNNFNYVIESIFLNYLKIKFDYIFFIKANLKNIFSRVLKRDNENYFQILNLLKIQKIFLNFDFKKNKSKKILLFNNNNLENFYYKINKIMLNILFFKK